MSNNEIYVSLDIGSSSVKVIIGEMANDTLNIIGVGNAKSKGIRKGSIVDIDDTVQTIRRAVEEAERMVGMQINQVIVGITGSHIGIQPCHGVVAVSSENREISDEDVYRVMDAAQVVSIPPEREIINAIPYEFIVDGLDDITDPRGMIGVRLEMHGLLITGLKTVLHNTLRCVERAGLDIVDIVLQPLATAAVVLSKDEQNLGTAIIDIGGGTTTMSVFEDGIITETIQVPIGGDHITKDLSIGLRTTSEAAEEIKIKYGYAFYDDASEEEVFSVPIIGSDQHQQFNQLEIADIIEARMEEIFELIAAELNRLGVRDLPGGFILTGGVASMPGVMELAQLILQNRVRVASPDYIGVREPKFSTAVGLIRYAYNNAKLQGINIGETVSEDDHYETTNHKKQTHHMDREKSDKNPEDTIFAKVKRIFTSFYE